MPEAKAPELYEECGLPKVFLAGSIDLGAAPDWRKGLADALSDEDVLLLNPRRDDWDASWEQSITDARFREQVEWELAGLEASDVIVLCLAPGTKSPISLLELGLFARSKKLVVCCPQGFWRKGNVDIVCERYAVTQTDSLDEALLAVRAMLKLQKHQKEGG